MAQPSEKLRAVLDTEVVFNTILSHLDWKSQTEARLVCSNWNNHILDSFHHKLALRVKRRNVDLNEIKSHLGNFDSRILSSIKDDEHPPVTEFLVLLLDILRTKGDACRFRSLKLRYLDKKGIEYLIKWANEGLLQNLRELKFKVWSETDGHVYEYSTIMKNDALPRLESLDMQQFPCFYDNDEDDVFKKDVSNFKKAFQSFITAAPNVESLTIYGNYDLSGLKNLRRLTLTDKHVDEDKPDFGMLKPVGKSLVFMNLRLFSLTPSDVTTKMPNLSTLEITHFSASYQERLRKKLDWTLFPNLKMLIFHRKNLPPHLDETFFAALFPLPPNILEFQLIGLAIGLEPEIEKLFNLILNLKLKRLVVKFDSGIKLSDLLRMLESPEIQVNESSNGMRTKILEFHNKTNYNDEIDKEPIRNYNSVMKKLQKNWSLVRFKEFKFQLEFIEVPLPFEAPAYASIFS